MTVALKLGVQKSNIVDTSNIGCVWHVLCMVYCCSDSDVQQTGLAQKDLSVVVLITMALIAMRDFHRVLSKRVGEIINYCIDDLEINAHTLKGDMIMHFLRESVFQACL